jgi:hypothetical protein
MTAMGDFRRAHYVCLFDGHYFVNDVQGKLERWDDGLALVDRRVLVKDLPRDHLVRMRGPDQEPSYPRPISLSISATSPVGNEYPAARRTAFNFVSGSPLGRVARASVSTRRTHSLTVRRSRSARRWMSDISRSESRT